MSKILIVPDETFDQLEKLASKQGIENVEQYLVGLWKAELLRRREVAAN